MRGFAVPAAVAPAWNRMKELRTLYVGQPLRSAVAQRFSAPLAWRKSPASGAAPGSDSTKRRLSAAARRRSSVSAGVLTATKSAAATRAALEASAAISEFEVLGVLGRGTFGVVKLARHVATGAAVALKVLDKRAVLELRQEKNILREQTVHLLLDHAFVSKLYATFQDKHALYFVVEYCPGGEVFSLVYDQPGSLTDDASDGDSNADINDDSEEEEGEYRRSNQHQHKKAATPSSSSAAAAAPGGDNQETNDDDEHTTSTTDSESEDEHAQERLRLARAAKLELFLANARGKQALKSAAFGGLQAPHVAFYLACLMVGLEYLHEMNILYRDLKLENLVLDSDGYPKLIDFGLSKPDAATHARNRTLCGSLEYMAPEVLQRLPYDQRADMWSFGVLMYELLFGATPFYHANAREQGRRITCEPVHFPNNFEDAFPDACELISRLLSKNPSERPTSFAQVRQSAFFKKYFPTPHAWARLQARQLPAPFVPMLDGPFDTSLFVKAASYEDEGDDLYGY